MTPNIPSGTEASRPFLPTKDFARSKAFYGALGFTKELDGEVAISRVGQSSIILQQRYDQNWAENMMMQLMVDDLDQWWEHLAALDLPARFGVPAPKPPEMQPWGLRIAFLIDPAGVLWHVAQRRAEVIHDR